VGEVALNVNFALSGCHAFTKFASQLLQWNIKSLTMFINLTN